MIRTRKFHNKPINVEQVMKINRKGSIPPYLQLMEILREQIQKGQYLPGDRLPSETKLCEQYNVSPMTVRRAIQALLDQSIVFTIKGSGTYVKAPDIRGGSFSLEEFYNIFSDPKRTKVKLLEALTVKADTEIAAHLMLNEGERTILIRRLLIRDGDPIVYHKEHLIYDPFRRVVETELEVTALHGLFVGKADDCLKWGELSMASASLSLREAGLLNTMPGRPAFHIEHVFFDFNDKPVSWGRFICRADSLRFTTIVGHKNKATA